MKIAIADPVYLGCAHRYREHPRAKVFDSLDGHRDLVARLVGEFPDGWALCLSAPSLRFILPLCPPDCRVGAWVKPFAAFKRGVNPAYTWEPVIWRGGRRLSSWQPTVRDYVSAPITLRRGVVGAKPEAFAFWVFAILGLEPRDKLVDLFPGSGAIGRAWASFCQSRRRQR